MLHSLIERLERSLREGSQASVSAPWYVGLPFAALGYGRTPPFWNDRPVREALLSLHREMTIDRLIEHVSEQFGRDRLPSRSAIHRIWQRIDKFKASHASEGRGA